MNDSKDKLVLVDVVCKLGMKHKNIPISEVLKYPGAFNMETMKPAEKRAA